MKRRIRHLLGGPPGAGLAAIQGRLARGVPEWARLAAAGLALGMALHLPALKVLGEALPGEPASDVLRAWWSAWLVADALPGWPFSSSRAGFPAGVDLVPFPALSLLLAAPLTLALGAAATVTLLVVGHVAMAFAATAALVRALGGGRGGALVAGALVTTQPLLGGALRDGTLEILAVGWIPLVLLAMVHAARGSWRWGVGAGLLFLATCLESVYHGSFAALGVLVSLTTLRSREGLRAVAVAGLTVALGVGVLALAFAPVIDNIGAAMGSAREVSAEVRAANAASFEGLRLLALHPGVRGWRIADLYAPPLVHWAFFAPGLLLALRRAAWLPLLGGLYLLLAVDDPLLSPWADGPVGQVVRFPRRYMAAVGVALGVGVGVGLRELVRWPRVELALGAALALVAAVSGARAGGWVEAYPLLPLPQPAFVEAIAADDEDCAVLMLPLEVPGEAGLMREEMPVFAALGPEIASADQLALQVLMDKAAWTTPSLVTLARRAGPTGLLPKNFTDLGRARAGGQAPRTARLAAEGYVDDLRWLMGEGLKYVVVSLADYDADGLTRLDEVLRPAAVAVTDHDDGGGVRVYQLYAERPARVEVPAESGGDMVAASFRGRVVDGERLMGRVRLRVRTGEGEVSCEVHPERATFECQGVGRVEGVELLVDDAPVTATRWSGTLLDARVEYEAPESMLQSQGPADVQEVVSPPTTPMAFTGRVEHHRLIPGAVWVHALAAEGPVRCPVTPETGAYDCGMASGVRQVRLLADDQEVPATWDEVVEGGVLTYIGGGPSGQSPVDGAVLTPQFSGVVKGVGALVGRTQLRVRGPEGEATCEVHPGTGQFRCPETRAVSEVVVLLNDVALPTTWDGRVDGAEVRCTADAALLARVSGTPRPGEGQDDPAAFTGRVEGHRRLTGFVQVVVRSEAGPGARCPVTPETGAYDCGVVDGVKDVLLTAGERQVASTWDGVVHGGLITYTGAGPGGGTGALPPGGEGAPPPPTGERGVPFEGVVTNREGLMGMIEVVISSEGRTRRCPVTPETGAFSCGFAKDVQVLGVRVEGRELPARWDGEVEGATVEIQR